MTKHQPPKKSLFKRILRLILRILLVVLIFLILLILFIRSPWGQEIIVGKATNYISEKIQTEFEIGKLYITFSGNISLEDFYVEDTSKDTLVYSKYLEANVPIRPLLFENEIQVDVVDWQGLKANINRKDSIEGFNFQFIIDAFASPEDDETLNSEQFNKTSSTPKILIDNIVFSDFEITYEDEVTGIDTALDLGYFEVSSEDINLEQMKFHLTEINLDNTRLKVTQFKPSASADDQTSSTLPWVIVDKLNLRNVKLDYQSIPDDMASEVFIDDFQFENLNAHLENQSIVLNTLTLKDSSLKLETKSASATKNKTSNANQNEPFSWPQWEVKINAIHIENQIVELYNTDNRPQKGRFNPEALALKAINLKINDINLSKDEQFSFHLNDLQFREESGFVLQEFQMQTKLNSEEANIEDLRLRMNQSLLLADLKFSYNNWQELINSPEQSSVYLDVKRLKANVRDGFIFSPELQSNEQLQTLAVRPIEASFIANGNMKQLDIPKFNLNWGKETHLSLQGHLSQLQDVENLEIDFRQIKAYTLKADLSKFISEHDLGLAWPEKLKFSGEIQKQANHFSTKSQLTSDFGTIALTGGFNSETQIDYMIDVDIQSFKLNQLLNNDELGQLDMQFTSQGEGNSIYELNTKLSSEISRLDWKAYTFSGLKLEGTLKKGQGDIVVDYTDDNLNFSISSQLDLDTVNTSINTKLDLQGIRTQNLGLTKKDLRAKVLAQFQFKGNTDQYQLDAQFKEGLVVYDNDPYYLGDVNFSTSIDSLKTKLKMSSSFLNAQFNANADVQRIFEALQHHFNHHLNTKSKDEDHQQEQPLVLDLNVDFIDTPILSEVFVDGIQTMDTLKGSLQFDSQKQELSSSLSLPYLNYQDKELSGLNLKLNSTQDALTFNFGFDQLFADPLDIAKTQLSGTLKEKILNLNLKAYEDDLKFFNASVSLAFEEDKLYRIKLSPEDLIFNGLAWSVLDSNELIYQNERLQVNDFELSRNGQEIKISDNFGFESDHLGLSFSNFKLSTLSSYFNPDEDLTNGDLSGELIIIEPFASKGLISDLRIKNFKVTQVPLGDLTLNAETKDNINYALDFNLMGSDLDFKLKGNYHTEEKNSEVNLNLDLHHFGLKTIEQFAGEHIRQSKGHLEGKFKIVGGLDSLDYNGNLAFKDIQFNLKALNTTFKLKDEGLEFSKEKVSFNNFTIKNKDDNPLRLNGAINFETLTNPDFDLAIEAQDFQLLNSTANDNDLYYGSLVFDTSSQLTGDLESPDVTMDLTVKNTSDLTYIVPESQASIEERDGIVVFVNKENPDDILNQQDDEAVDAVISGVNLQSQINIQRQANVQVIFNKRTNDNISLQGGGNFTFDMSRTGKMNLVGQYEVTKGSVELNFYNLVKRQFQISPSSTVTWNGNPYNANLDLRAIYNIETSVSSLMASQTAGENAVIKNRYKQRLPFQVYLDVGGELTSPDLSFKLDMPEDRQGAINGSVFGKITQINQQDDELNKQVFSLLVLNKFYPESGSDGSQGGAASLARDNINQALTDQLNAFSDNLTGNTGINLNFDVNSYTDYQGSSAQERTDVDVSAQKKLLDDRLVVEAGSQVNVQGQSRAGETQGVLGNVSVEYLLTEDGRWKLKGFRKSEYENVIDGQVFVSGIALIFTREFNKFKVLWDKAYRESLIEDEDESKTKKAMIKSTKQIQQ